MNVERRRRADKRAIAALGLVVAMSAFGLYRVETGRRDADTKIKAAAIARADQARQESRDRAAQIERSRVDVLIRSCRQTNRNHDKVIVRLDHLIAALPPGRRRARATRSRSSTVFLLEALAPHRHCLRRAHRLIR